MAYREEEDPEIAEICNWLGERGVLHIRRNDYQIRGKKYTAWSATYTVTFEDEIAEFDQGGSHDLLYLLRNVKDQYERDVIPRRHEPLIESEYGGYNANTIVWTPIEEA
jgi:hypothetical protein